MSSLTVGNGGLHRPALGSPGQACCHTRHSRAFEQMTFQIPFPRLSMSALPELKLCPPLKTEKVIQDISIFAISVRNAFKAISVIMGTDRSMLFSTFLPLGYSRKLILCFINVYAQQSVVTQSFITISTTVTHEKCHCISSMGSLD